MRTLLTLPPEATREIFQTHGEIPNWPAYYNAAPTTALPVVRDTTGGGRELVLMQWGSSCGSQRTTSPRIRLSTRKPKDCRPQRHIASPSRGPLPGAGVRLFRVGRSKTDRQPHYFTRADGQPMALAGLWDRWRSKDKSETKETFTIVTTEPSKFAAQFHNRMPLVLEPEIWDLWMKGDPDVAAALMMLPAEEDVLVSRPVSKAVGNVKNNSAELLA